MRLAYWAALLLLILSFTCCMWIAASLAVNLLLPTALPSEMRLSPGETVIAVLICMIAPVTLAGASGFIWFFGIRRQKPTHASPQAYASRQQPQSPAPAEVREQQVATLGIEQYLEQLSALLLTDDLASTSAVRPKIKALTRQALTTFDPIGKQRILFCLPSLMSVLGDEPLDLYGLDLAGVDLRFASLRAVNLAGAHLRGAKLTGVDLRGADLSDCDLSEADLRLSCLDNACLERARLSRARLQRARLRTAKLHHAQMDQANLWQADLREAQVSSAQLATAVSIEGAILPGDTHDPTRVADW